MRVLPISRRWRKLFNDRVKKRVMAESSRWLGRCQFPANLPSNCNPGCSISVLMTQYLACNVGDAVPGSSILGYSGCASVDQTAPTIRSLNKSYLPIFRRFLLRKPHVSKCTLRQVLSRACRTSKYMLELEPEYRANKNRENLEPRVAKHYAGR